MHGPGVVGWRGIVIAAGVLGLVAGGCGGGGHPVSSPRVPLPPVRTAWEVPTPKGFRSVPTTPESPTGVLTLQEAAHLSIPENGNSEDLRRAGWKSGVALTGAAGRSTGHSFFSNVEIDQFGSTKEAAAYQAKWEASYRHAFGDVTFGRVPGYDGPTFRYFYGVGGGPFYSIFIAFRQLTYVFTWWGDGFVRPPLSSPTMQRVAEDQFLRLPGR